jgi:hypothetical protein
MDEEVRKVKEKMEQGIQTPFQMYTCMYIQAKKGNKLL